MKLSKSILIVGLLSAWPGTSLLAYNADTAVSQAAEPLHEAYLSHWFSYDSAEPSNLTIEPLASDELGERAEIHFTSDDGQIVNGIIAFPLDKDSSQKLAFALHPMGTDQNFWWSDKSPLAAQKLTQRLREQGYTVISLDARRHGERGRPDFGPRELLTRAHSSEPRLYIDTIIGSVRDYRIALKWATVEFEPSEVLVMGYSMGAQMSLLLASFEPSVDAVVVMVPPYVGSDTSPVAPRVHANRVANAKVLWLAGTKDPHSNGDQTQATFDLIASSDKTLAWFEAGHRLPPEFLDTVLSFFDSIDQEAK